MDNQTGLSAQIPSTPAPAPVAGTSAPPDFGTLVPEPYRDAAWLEPIAKSDDPVGTLFKNYANAQELIGKKQTGVEIPGADAPPEKVKEFFKALGVPDSPDGYEYKQPDLSKESEVVQKLWAEEAKDESFRKDMAKLAHEAGLTPTQWNKLQEGFLGKQVTALKAMAQSSEEQAAQQGQAAREAFKAYYGERAEAVERIAQETVGKVIPKEVAAMGADTALIHAMHFIHEKLYANDKVTTPGAGGSGSTWTNAAELHAHIQKLRDNPLYTDKMAPGHEAYFKNVDALYREHSAMSKAEREANRV
jgi:hypothetical protein